MTDLKSRADAADRAHTRLDRATTAAHGLSRACHHQVYELSPTEAELSTTLDAVNRLLAHDPLRR